MSHDDGSWPVVTAQFLDQLYGCAWQTLAPFLSVQTRLDLIAMSTQTLRDAYPFLGALVWTSDGLEAASLHRAIGTESLAHVQAGGERLLQELQRLVHTCGGALLAQRLQAATERSRAAFDPALSKPAPAEDAAELGLADGAEPEAVAQGMGHQALRLYQRLR